jgi:hypothetical protein
MRPFSAQFRGQVFDTCRGIDTQPRAGRDGPKASASLHVRILAWRLLFAQAMRDKRSFIQDLASVCLLALLAVTAALAEQQPNPVTAEEAALWPKTELALHACKVYRTNCYRCHRTGGFAAREMDYVMDSIKLVTKKQITKGSLEQSPAYYLPAYGQMPPDGALVAPEPDLVTKKQPALKLTADQVLGLWVLAGAPDWEITGTGDQLQCK